MNPQTTLVLGASEKPDRYSYKAVTLLQQKQYPVYALGFKAGFINQS
ncbi:MAG: CoA-binding protein, partial [Chitinophagaceae bacterium]|nr:CoA-binding protein [Chitinophagaceae bacterium]